MAMATVNNGVNVQALLDAREVLKGAPEAAQFTWRASCKWQKGTHSTSKVRGFFGLGQEQQHKTETSFEADHPEKAIEIAKTHEGHIHLLLTDMVMPGMNGRALAEKLAHIRPDMKVVYTSGYTRFSHSALLDPDLVFLPKPFTRESLLSKLRQILTSDVEVTAS